MTEASYTAWDDKQYVWPPPEGWYQAADQKWWPEGYGPQPTPDAPAAEAAPDSGVEAAAAVDSATVESATVESATVDAATDTQGAATEAATAVEGAAAETATAAKGASTGILEGVTDTGAGALDVAAGASDVADGAVASAKDSVAGVTDAVEGASSEGLSGSLPGAGVLAGGAAAAAGLAGGAAAATGRLGDSVKDAAKSAVLDVEVPDVAVPDVDVAVPDVAVPDVAVPAVGEKAADAIAKVGDVTDTAGDRAADAVGGLADKVESAGSAASVPSAGVFDSAPMEMNNLSPSAATPLASRALDGSLPEVEVPEVTVPDVSVPEVTVPDVNTPDVKVSDIDLPDVDLPDVDLPDVDLPDVELPDVEVPAVEVPDVALPEVSDIAAPDLTAPDLAAPDLTAPDLTAPNIAAAGPDWAGAPAPDADLWANPTSVPGTESALGAQGLAEQPQAQSIEADEYNRLAQTEIQPTGPAQFPDAQAARPAMVNQGLDPNDMLHAKPKGRRSLRWLWVLLGILVLAAACAAAYYFLQNRGDDDPVVDPVEATGPGSAAEPHARETGVVVFYPDGDANQRWIVEVLEPVRDATADYTTAPADGEIFAATRIRVRNESGVDGASLADLEFNAVNAAGELIRREDNECGTTSTDLQYDAAVNLGTVLEGTVCWEIPAADVAGLKLGVESNKVGGRVHIELN